MFRIIILIIHVLAFSSQYKANLVNSKQKRVTRCPRSDLPEGIKIHGPCNYQPNRACKASCRYDGATLWRRDIKCTSGGRWSIGHKCRERAFFKVVPCPELVEELPGEKQCIKISQEGKGRPKESVCPELLRIYVQMGKCRRIGRGECAVSCLEDGFSLLCMARGVWYPHCRVAGTHKAVCPATLPPSKIIDCPARTPGSECKLRCPDGKIAAQTILCSPDGRWTRLPKCHLKQRCPQLNDKQYVTETCTRKVGSSCRVRCKSGNSWTNAKCAGNGVWSGLPACKTCPKLTVKNSKKSCLGKAAGQKCKIECKTGYKLKGPNLIQCTDKLQWTAQPTCIKKCSLPKLEENNLKASDACTGKLPGQTCKLQCAQGGKMSGENTIKCLDDGSWSVMPKCYCPPPSLTSDLVVNEDDCSSKEPKETCPLRCQDTTAKLTGSKFITCQENTKWSRLPSCGSAYCQPPIFTASVLKTKEDCSKKPVNQICNLECRNGGDLVGKDHVKCMGNQQWSPAPNCTCSQPNLAGNVELDGPCTTLARGETCNVKCKSGFKFEGKLTITCQQDWSWSSQPTCTKLCPKPKLSEKNLKSDEICGEKASGSSCKLSCVEGGKIMGDNVIKCLQNGEWTPLPECYCPKPILTADLIEKSDCSAIKLNGRCELGCRNSTSKLTGNHFIVCNSDTKWGQLPTCSATQCPLPSFAKGDVRATEDCSRKSIHSTCSLECSKGGNLVGEGNIKCLKDQTWSPLPECTCPIPKLGPRLEFNVPCDNVAKNRLCSLKCKAGYEILGRSQIECREDLEWNYLASVKCKKRCPDPNFSEHYVSPTHSCSGALEDQTCMYKCSSGGRMVKSLALTALITCQEDGTWSRFEQCYCPLPVLPSDVTTANDCGKIRPFETCYFLCVDSSLNLIGNKVAECRTDLVWKPYEVKCDKSCWKPNFKSPALKVGDDCNQRFPGQTCKVSCANFGLIIGTDTLHCLEGGVWSPFPVCTCPKPFFDGTFLRSEEDCYAKKPLEYCKVQCTMGYRAQSEYIQCKSNSQWDALPACYKVACTELTATLNFPSAMYDTVECEENRCRLSCKFGYFHADAVADPYGRCEDGRWLYPACACVDQVIRNGVHNCKYKTPPDTCSVSCNNGFFLRGLPQGQSDVTCLNDAQWSHLPGCTKCPEYTGTDPDTSVICGNYEGDWVCDVKCYGGTSAGGTEFRSTCVTVDPRKVPEDLYYGRAGYTIPGDTFWKPPLQCEKRVCGDPYVDLPYKIGSIAGHSVGSETTVLCADPNLQTYSVGALRCDEKLVWIPKTYPDCSAPAVVQLVGTRVCPLYTLPDWLVADDICNEYFVHGTCRVKCKNGGVMVSGENPIRCLETAEWTPFPVCMCPAPDMGLGFKLREGFCGHNIGEKCTIICNDQSPSNINKQAFVECTFNMKWEWLGMLNCETTPQAPAGCPDVIKPPVGVILHEQCINKPFDSYCRVSCSKASLGIVDTFAHCQSNGEWKFPECFCPDPETHFDTSKFYRDPEQCTDENMLKSENCIVNCRIPMEQLESERDHQSVMICINNQWIGPDIDCKPKPFAQLQPGFKKRSDKTQYQQFAYKSRPQDVPQFYETALQFHPKTWEYETGFQNTRNPKQFHLPGTHFKRTMAEIQHISPHYHQFLSQFYENAPQVKLRNLNFKLSAGRVPQPEPQRQKSVAQFLRETGLESSAAVQIRSNPAQFHQRSDYFHASAPHFQGVKSQFHGREPEFHPSDSLFQDFAAQTKHSTLPFPQQPVDQSQSNTWAHPSDIQKRSDQYIDDLSIARRIYKPAPHFQRSKQLVSQFQPAFPWMQTTVLQQKRKNLCKDRGAPCDEVVFCPPITSAPGGIDYFMEHVLFPMQDCDAVPSGGVCVVRCRNGLSVHGGGQDVKVPLGDGILAGKMTCGDDGVWSAPYSCNCREPDHVGIDDVSTAKCGDTFSQSSCTVQCAAGFEQRLDAIWCEGTGFWRQNEEPCVSGAIF